MSDLVGPVMLSRDEEGRLTAKVEGVRYVLVARRGGEPCPPEATPDVWQRLDKLAREVLELGEKVKATHQTTQAVNEVVTGCKTTSPSTGANWFVEHVYKKARVFFLQGRLTFVGERDPYPKDLILAAYGPGLNHGFEVWAWGGTRSEQP